MSYDVYSYRPSSGVPNATEAQALIEDESDEGAARWNDEEAHEARRIIANALLKYNPRLQPLGLDNNKANHIELNSPKGDLAIQLEVYWDHVFLSVPYWYKGPKAHQVFEHLLAYLRVIRETVGFFAYDPQTGRAFDPATRGVDEFSQYEDMIDKITATQGSPMKRKLWWKFW